MKSVARRWVLFLSTLGLGTWWIVSVVVHTALFGAIAATAPAPAPSSGSSDEIEMTVSPDRVRDIVEAIREDESKRLADKLSELVEIKETLDQLNVQKVAQYNQVMKEEASRAPERIAEAQAEALAAQGKALQAQARAQGALERRSRAQASVSEATSPEEKEGAEADVLEATWEAMEAQSEVKLAQSQAAAAQELMRHRLHLISGSWEAQSTLSAAEEAQQGATTKQEDAEAFTNKISSTKKALRPGLEIAAKEEAALEKRSEQLASAEKTLSERRAEFAEAQDDKARKQLAQAEERVAKYQEVWEKQRQRTEDARSTAGKRQATLESAVANAESEQRVSTELQQKAVEVQRKADEAISSALANHDPNGDNQLEEVEPKIVETPNREASLSEVYQQAQAAEQAIAETYRNGRAAELAAIRKIPMEEAMKLTEVAKPDRPALDTSILKKDIAEVGSLRAQEKAITNVAAQMESMLALARRMRELAVASESDLRGIQAKSSASERLEKLAMEESSTRAKDLSGEMNGSDDSPAWGYNEQGISPEMMGVSYASAVWSVKPFDPQSLSALATAMQVAALTRRGAGGGGLEGSGGQGWGKGVAGIAGVDPKDFRPIPGRTIRAGSVSIEEGRNPAWMYVDSWHLIGPWPNPRRKNLHTKFPPETVVDLDARYQGGRKDEVPLPITWQFHQLPPRKGEGWTAGMINPPGMRDFEIYYGYTELWFDQAADLWVAIGSDDQSKVWLNDQLIWKSADYYKAWAPNEGLRKVHFRKGINRVLYRLENGQLGGGFSFLVCLAEPK